MQLHMYIVCTVYMYVRTSTLYIHVSTVYIHVGTYMYMQLYMYVHVPEWVERFLQSVEDGDVLWLRIKYKHVTVQHTGHHGNTTGGLSIVLRPDSDHHLGWERRRGEEERGKERGKETGEGDMEKEREGGGRKGRGRKGRGREVRCI